MDDGIPELEDIPNVCEAKSNFVIKKTESKFYLDAVNSIETKESAVKNESDSAKSFGGFKKGFLNAQSSSTKAKADSNIIHLKADKLKQNDTGFYQDIKQAVKDSSSGWITDDFLEKLQKNEKLYKGFQNNRLLNKISKFKENPKEALKDCENDKEAQDFLMEFMKTMGIHLMNNNNDDKNGLEIHSQKLETTVTNDKEVADLLANDEVKDLLMDNDVQKLFKELKMNPEKSSWILKNANGTMKSKIQKLIAFGLLGIQS